MGNGISVVEDLFKAPIKAVNETIGDLAFPDNPKRRARLEQLQDDIKTMKNEFEELQIAM